MFWCVSLTCKGSLTSPLYIDSCWVYLTLRSLTSPLYMIHVCRGSFTSPLMHCILCFMWLGSSHLFSCNACMQGELILRLSSSWMYIAFISLLLVFLSPLCWWIDKKGEKYLESLYMHVYFISLFMKKGREEFAMHVYFHIYAHICVVWFMHFIEYLFVYWYAWVKGKLLWSLSLIHAYITPWVLSSSKRGRLLAQRLIALVLMMINSCSYSTKDLVFI